MSKENKELVKKALDNAKKIVIGKDDEGKDITYLDSMLNQRIEGSTNAGSSYPMEKNELLQALKNGDWEEIEHPEVQEGCRCFKIPLKGLEGILDVEELDDNTRFFAMDPKKTGKISIGAANVKKKEVNDTYLIVGKEEIDGNKEDVVFTFHPGEPVRPSIVDIDTIRDGEVLDKDKLAKYGFSKVKFMSDEMVKEYQNKSYELVLKDEKLDGLTNVEKLYEIRDRREYIDSYTIEALINDMDITTLRDFLNKEVENIEDVYWYGISDCCKKYPELIEDVYEKFGMCPNLPENSEIFENNPDLKEKLMYKMRGCSEDRNYVYAERNGKKYEICCESSYFAGLNMGACTVDEVENFDKIKYPLKDDMDSEFYIDCNEKVDDNDYQSISKIIISKYFEYYEGKEYATLENMVTSEIKLDCFEGAREAELEEKKQEEQKRIAERERIKELERKSIVENKFRSISDLKRFVSFKFKEFKNREDKEAR